MLTEIQSMGRGLTRWEESFIEDISDQMERTGNLTPSQSAVLARIYNERVR
jgi:hypothetical protein